MGNPGLVSVRVISNGIITVNGRTGTVAKGMTLDVDPATARQYDFLEVIPEAHAPKVEKEPVPVEEGSGTTPRKKSRGRKSKDTSGDQEPHTDDERIP